MPATKSDVIILLDSLYHSICKGRRIPLKSHEQQQEAEVRQDGKLPRACRKRGDLRLSITHRSRQGGGDITEMENSYYGFKLPFTTDITGLFLRI